MLSHDLSFVPGWERVSGQLVHLRQPIWPGEGRMGRKHAQVGLAFEFHF